MSFETFVFTIAYYYGCIYPNKWNYTRSFQSNIKNQNIDTPLTQPGAFSAELKKAVHTSSATTQLGRTVSGTASYWRTA